MYEGETITADAASLSASHGKRIVPGEAGIWVFIFADLVTFAIFFMAFFKDRALQPEAFALARHGLTINVALINTLVLLTSSLLVVVGVNAIRQGQFPAARIAIRLAMLCGAIFIGLKLYEYGHMVGEGKGAAAGIYYNYFYVLTGLHFAHVLGGLVILRIMLAKAKTQTRLSPREFHAVESGACYWHLVDLLWMVIFPLLYMVA